MLNTNHKFSGTRSAVFILILILICQIAFSQRTSDLSQVNLGYKDFIKMVVTKNLEYFAEKFNINISEAKIEAARVFQDPSLSFDYSRNKEENSFTGYSVSAEVSKTFELGNKRRARINVAESESTLAKAQLDDYLRNLMADATLDYLNALKQKYLDEVMLNSYQMMKELSGADSIRFSLGSIKAIDATQSKIEAGILLNNLLQIDADRKNSFLNLSTRTSSVHSDTLFFPVGKFDKSEKSFVLSDLLITALNNRADLLAAKNNITVQQNLLTLTKSERKADIDLKAGTINTYLNKGISSPMESQIYAGIAVPIKFSNINKGEIIIARFQIEQVELIYKQTEIKIQNEVVQAYFQYKSLCRQVENYNQGLLEQAKAVLDGKVYSYSRGETSLLEVLNAQRTYNDLQTSYYETLYKCNAALVELERSIGTYNIDL
jgi:outer membrane protein, heavy metal efflux system